MVKAPVDGDCARAHVYRLLTEGATRVGIAAVADLDADTVSRALRPGRRIAADTETALLAVTIEAVRASAEPDEVLLQRLVDGADEDIPIGTKEHYIRALYRRGWPVGRIAEVTKAAGATVRNVLLQAELRGARTELAVWRDACETACERVEYLERVLHRVLSACEQLPDAQARPIRAAVFARSTERQPVSMESSTFEHCADAILADKRLDFRPRGTLADRMRWAAAVLIEADKRVTDEPPGGWDAQGLQDFAARFEREDADRAIEATDA